MMYSRLASGAESLRPYLREVVDKKVTMIDYELIRDSQGKSLVGSSKLAGSIGMFNAFRVLGEFMLLRDKVNTPLLHIGGSAYMHRDYQECLCKLKEAFERIQE